MRVVLVAVGTRGDVAPYTGLAAALAAVGHQPVIATHAPFRELVEASGAEFRPLPMDVRAELSSPEGRRSLRTSPLGPARYARLMARRWRELGEATVPACEGADGLPRVGPAQLFRRMERERWPVLYGFSPVVVPPPADWPPDREVTGYWWPHVRPGWEPP